MPDTFTPPSHEPRLGVSGFSSAALVISLLAGLVVGAGIVGAYFVLSNGSGSDIPSAAEIETVKEKIADEFNARYEEELGYFDLRIDASDIDVVFSQSASDELQATTFISFDSELAERALLQGKQAGDIPEDLQASDLLVGITRMSFEKENGEWVIAEIPAVYIGTNPWVITASLNKAREQGNDASIKARLSQLRVQAELFYDGNNLSYQGLEADQEVQSTLEEISEKSPSRAVCESASDAYRCYAELNETENTRALYFCVDSTGVAQEMQSDPSEASDLTCNSGSRKF